MWVRSRGVGWGRTGGRRDGTLQLDVSLPGTFISPLTAPLSYPSLPKVSVPLLSLTKFKVDRVTLDVGNCQNTLKLCLH